MTPRRKSSPPLAFDPNLEITTFMATYNFHDRVSMQTPPESSTGSRPWIEPERV